MDPISEYNLMRHESMHWSGYLMIILLMVWIWSVDKCTEWRIKRLEERLKDRTNERIETDSEIP